MGQPLVEDKPTRGIFRYSDAIDTTTLENNWVDDNMFVGLVTRLGILVDKKNKGGIQALVHSETQKMNTPSFQPPLCANHKSNTATNCQ